MNKEIPENDNQQLISVVMAVYNGEHYIRETIESVQAQTHSNFEFIIIDDGSKDNTAAIIKEYASRDNRIKYYYQKNAGTSAALNYGDRLANAEFIARMDSDDIMLPTRLEKQVEFLRNHPEVSAASCLAYYINGKGKILGKNSTDILTVQDCRQYVTDNKIIFCLHPGAIFRKSVLMNIGGYDENIIVCHDVELWNRMADAGYYMVVMPEILMKYRIHPYSLMSSFKERLHEADWAKYNIRQKRIHKEPVSFKEYQTLLKNYPLSAKIKLWRNQKGDYYYRKAGLLLGEKSYLSFAFAFLFAIAVRPVYVYNKIKSQIRLKDKMQPS